MAKNDVLPTPTKQHPHTPSVLMYNETRSSPYFGQVHLLHYSSDSDCDKTTQFSDEAEACTLKIKANFTPAPVSHPSQPDLSKPAFSDVPNALKELVEIMQG